VRDELIGKRVKCPACGAAVLVRRPPEPEPTAVAEALPEDELSPQRRKTPVAADRADPDDARPARGARRPRDDDDEPPRRRKGKPKRGSRTVLVWAAVGAGALVVVAVAVVFAIIWGRKDEPTVADGQRPAGGTRQIIQPKETPEHATLEKLHKDFTDDRAKALQEYGGKEIVVEGLVSGGHDGDPNNPATVPYVVLEWKLACLLPAGTKTDDYDGTTLKIRGRVQDLYAFGPSRWVRLADCKILSVNGQ
jgi:hypothetical protein